MTAKMAHTGLTVSDLDRSLAFWRDALGMVEAFSQEKQGGYLEAIVAEPGAHVRMTHLEFPGGGHRLELFQYLAPEGRHVRLRPRDGRGVYVRDPDGHVVELFTPPRAREEPA